MNDDNKRYKMIKNVLICANLSMAGWSTFVFLVFLQVPVWLWLFLNICAPTQYATILTLIRSKNKNDNLIPKNIVVPLLFRFGTGGLFFFPWSGNMLTAQVSHIVMTITAIFIAVSTLSSVESNRRNKMIVGLIVGMIIVLIIDFIMFPIVFSNPLAQFHLESLGFTG